MSDSKLLRIYLDLIGAKIHFCSGGLVTIEYNNKNGCDIYDSYAGLLIHVRRLLK